MSSQNWLMLEQKLDQLLKKMTELADDNTRLKAKLAQSVANENLLKKKNAELAHEIKRIISNLKEEIS